MAFRQPVSLATLSDVALSGLSDAEVLTYIAAASRWENEPAAGGAASGGSFPYTVGPEGSNSSTAWFSSNAASFHRIVGASLAISKIAEHQGASAGNVSVGVYADAGPGNPPGARVATSGSVACPATGYAEISLGGTYTVDAGAWFAFSCSDSGAQFRTRTGGLGPSAYCNGFDYRMAAAHPLPAGVPAVSTPGDTSTRILLRGVA